MMKRIPLSIAALVCAFALSGCAIARAKKTAPDGSVVQASVYRFIWSTEGFKANYGDLHIELQKSSADAQTASAIAEGAVRGALATQGKPPTP
jgi:hypothetical protein